MISKRDLLLASAAGLATAGLRSAPAADVAAGTTTAHDMSQVPASWMGKEQIAFLVYPEFTALDMVGPHAMLTGLIGATTHIVGKSRDIVKSDTGLMFQPSTTFDECPLDLDIICVPGGSTGTLAAMQDDGTLRFLRDRGSRAKFVTSVCTGSLLLGAAGLFTGYNATSHWATVSLLPLFGATQSDDRIVRDRNRITAGGVTSGIDFGLSLVGQLRDRQYAESVQLMAQYAPEPPYDAGTPAKAPVEVSKMMTEMFVDFNKQAEKVARQVYPRYRNG
ncbi:DJ-1/PfpI family protein [Bradyrhizobium ontarionense]|uniref:DJ-1/PfpI family protein n=1 Tax=Bradyrhizobium ontarionense TaxID=2898149 RepID=A0ABY3R6C3_9BRAD|nr:DJ-1/PfpI family protein [Bradyrhizobium sp. A19]UFZ02743.1 DJ-1/PfpI family protein [Bradyrhizobium sp. A19]